MTNYKKRNCLLCQAKKETFWFYPRTPEEDKDIFWCAFCKTCKDIMIIFKWHNEPSDTQVEHMVAWAKEWFPLRIPDFQRRRIPDHFHFHLRRAKGKIDIKKRITFMTCSACENLFESKKMKSCHTCHSVQCKECFKIHGCKYCKQEGCCSVESLEEELIETQFDDTDAEVLGYE